MSDIRKAICRGWFSTCAVFDGGEGSYTIVSGELTLPKDDRERLQDAENEEKEILSSTPPATAPPRDPRSNSI